MPPDSQTISEPLHTPLKPLPNNQTSLVDTADLEMPVVATQYPATAEPCLLNQG